MTEHHRGHARQIYLIRCLQSKLKKIKVKPILLFLIVLLIICSCTNVNTVTYNKGVDCDQIDNLNIWGFTINTCLDTAILKPVGKFSKLYFNLPMFQDTSFIFDYDHFNENNIYQNPISTIRDSALYLGKLNTNLLDQLELKVGSKRTPITGIKILVMYKSKESIEFRIDMRGIMEKSSGKFPIAKSQINSYLEEFKQIENIVITSLEFEKNNKTVFLRDKFIFKL